MLSVLNFCEPVVLPPLYELENSEVQKIREMMRQKMDEIKDLVA